jgi:hypothetical protein
MGGCWYGIPSGLVILAALVVRGAHFLIGRCRLFLVALFGIALFRSRFLAALPMVHEKLDRLHAVGRRLGLQTDGDHDGFMSPKRIVHSTSMGSLGSERAHALCSGDILIADDVLEVRDLGAGFFEAMISDNVECADNVEHADNEPEGAAAATAAEFRRRCKRELGHSRACRQRTRRICSRCCRRRCKRELGHGHNNDVFLRGHDASWGCPWSCFD